jgi:type 1 fimbria pilin
MKHLRILFVAALLTLALAATQAMAHTALCNCFDNGDGTITCEGGFSDGSSASGVAVSVLDAGGAETLKGTMDANSQYTFKKPDGKYTVKFSAGEGHEVLVPSDKIVQ